MKRDELISTVGGATRFISASLLNSIIRGLNTILELGRSLGTAIRRGRNNMCSF